MPREDKRHVQAHRRSGSVPGSNPMTLPTLNDSMDHEAPAHRGEMIGIAPRSAWGTGR
jgi:hypothetical protein